MKSSKSPKALTMRDRKTGQPVSIPVDLIPKELWPETWYENVYWRYSGALEAADVMLFMAATGPITDELAQKLATYIYDFTANTAVTVWLMLAATGTREHYLNDMRECLAKLAALKAQARTREVVMDMVHVCLDYAVDPF